MNFLNRLRYGSLAADQEEAETLEYREAKKKDYADDTGDHDYGKSSIPEKYTLDLVEKSKGKYWMTKQFVKEKLGIGVDMFSVAEDADLYEQVHRARHTQKQMALLSQALAKYQKAVQSLTSKETALGLLLSAYGESEASAGMPGSDTVLKLGLEEGVQPCRELMMKLGGALQRDALLLSDLDWPVAKLSHEVENFRGKTVEDCVLAITELNTAKMKFRGALLWMTDAADALSDPDAKKELNNFREAQYMVKVCKKEYEEAAVKVCSKTGMLLTSLNNLFAMHLPDYVSVIGNQLKASESNYRDIYQWTRRTLVNQYRSSFDARRDQAMAEASHASEDGFANFSGRDDSGIDSEEYGAAKFENWSNETCPVAGLEEQSGPHALDWMESMQGENSKNGSHTVSPSRSQIPEDASVNAVDEMKNLEQNLDLLLAGDEEDLEELLPVDEGMKERQRLEVAREEKIGLNLEEMLAGLDFTVANPVDSAEEQEKNDTDNEAEGDTAAPAADAGTNSVNERAKAELNNVTEMWAALGKNFSRGKLDSIPLNDDEEHKSSASESTPETARKSALGSFLSSFSRRSPKTSEGGQSLMQEDERPVDKFASVLSKLEPGADERLLEGLMGRDSDCEDDNGVALM